MPFVSITRLRLRSFWHLPRFVFHALRSEAQARKAAGNMGVVLFNDAKLTFWTKTLWRDEASMRAYILADPHLKAMRVLQELVDEASVAHWNQEASTLPTWPEAYNQLLAVGRFTKIKHPSADHAAGKITPPRS